MFRFVVLAACLALCKGHAVPVVAAHTVHGAVISPYHHGYTGLGAGHGHIGGYASGYGHGPAGHVPVAGHGLAAGYGLAAGHGFGAGHGYGAGNGFGAGVGLGNGFGAGHGLIGGHGAHEVVHHILKRSPHFVAPLAHEAPVVVAPVHVEPVAISHQHRVDLHAYPSALPVFPIKPVVAPYLHGATLIHKPFGAHYGAGSYGHF